MTVKQLREMLASFDDNAEIGIWSDYNEFSDWNPCYLEVNGQVIYSTEYEE